MLGRAGETMVAQRCWRDRGGLEVLERLGWLRGARETGLARRRWRDRAWDETRDETLNGARVGFGDRL